MKTAAPRQASRSLRPLAAFFALSAMLCAAACKPVIIGGHHEGGSGGSGGCGTGGDSATGGGATGPVNAIAVPYVLIANAPPPDGSSSDTGSSGAGGGGVDPNTLYVQIGNFSQSCGANDEPYCVGAPVWQVSVGIPPALQVPGVIQLSDPNLISFFSENSPNSETPGDCGGGGGSFLDGTLEIVSIDAGTIVVILSGTSSGFGDVDVDGEYTAPICPTGV
jgi:hypothetical protein